MKILAAAAFVAAITVGTGASALSTTTYSDADFNAAVGANGDKAITEFRWGDSGGAATWEVGVGFPTSVTATQNSANYAWTGSENFVLSYDGAGKASLQFGGANPFLTYTGIDTTGFSGLGIRVRGGKTSTTQLTNLSFGGDALPDITSPIDAGSVLGVTGIDVASAWTLSGTLLFNGAGKNSAPSIQIKLADLPSEVPLPAAAWMLLAALGGLAGMGARRKAA